MAQVILSSVGGQIGGPIGQMIGSAAGAQIDRAAIQSLAPTRQIGPRLDQLRVQGTSEGAPIPVAFGRVRVVGQIIWAARFRESRHEARAGKGGPGTVDYGYSLSFAVGLCEGPIDGIGRVWADGQPLDVGKVAMRVHRGTEDQMPDSLIEAVEGAAPAYRGLAYVVFEDLSLEAFGDRVPQLAFEVFRRPRGEAPRLEDKLEGVCLIPGAGEFVYSTTPVLRRERLFGSRAENLNNRDGRADLIVSLDQLQAQLPNLKRVTLVVSWFGDDLRCGECQVRPRVDRADKVTLGAGWRVSGLERGDAGVVSEIDGAPADGGTPSDDTVIAAIAELKRRGLEVTLAPFLMMDVPASNGLADPYGAAEQGAYPWRGRVTCHPAAGKAGTVDGTGTADAQVAAFFGAAEEDDFEVREGRVDYEGSDDWGWRRMVLHYAHLATLAGADGLLIGSEFRGLTTVRGAAAYPAVQALKRLAQDCRSILGSGVLISYAADWSEWNGVKHADDPGGFAFHLDPLWAEPAISCVGIDWYPPVSDWRDGAEHLDAMAGWRGADAGDYLRAGVQSGEGYDWFYADVAARMAQDRTPIVDPAHDEAWQFRPKDIAGWWSRPHYDRPAGARSATPTDWVPGMKPVRLFEFGCGAIDRGGNAPNLFVDSKSAESAVPPFSDGRRDDLMQRRHLEATLDAFAETSANPAAPAWDGRMIDAVDAWCWDARPFPDFPARLDVWADGDNWRTGHWLNGRLSREAADLVAVIASRSGLDPTEIDVSGVSGVIDGYLIDRPMTTTAAIGPLLAALGVEAAERGDRAAFLGRTTARMLTEDDLASPDEGVALTASRTLEAGVSVLRARFIDGAADYAVGAVVVRADDGQVSRDVDLPMVLDEGRAEQAAARLLAREKSIQEQGTIRLAPLTALVVEAGDVVSIPGLDGLWRVLRVELDEQPRAIVEAVFESARREGVETWRPGEPLSGDVTPWLLPLDLPLEGVGPLAAVAGEPWRTVDIHVGASAESLSLRARATAACPAGQLIEDLPPGPIGRWDEAATMKVRWQGRAPEAKTAEAVQGGRNILAVIVEGQDPEIVQFRAAEEIEVGVWSLSGLLRGQAGTERRASQPTPHGAWVVAVEGLTPVPLDGHERGLPLIWRTAPAGAPPGGEAEDAAMVWRGLSERPWAPAHLRGDWLTDGALALSWIRRARTGGDGWDREPPLSEEREIYRVQICAEDAIVFETQVETSSLVWSADAQAEVFPEGTPTGLAARVAQGSVTFGWGEPAALRL